MVKGIARYQFSAPGSAPYSTISRRNRSTSSWVIPPLRSPLSNRPPGWAASCSGRRGVWKTPMYQDENAWRVENIALRNAAGCGTDTAVQVRSSSGRCIAVSQPELEPQSCPTRCTGPPMVSIRATTSDSSLCIV